MKLLKEVFLVVFLFSPTLSFAESSSEFYEQALEAYAQEDFTATYLLLKNSLQQDDSNLPAKILLGKILLINTYMYEAQEVLEEALVLGGDPSLIVDTLGKVWLYTEQYSKILDRKFSTLTMEAQTDWQLIVATAHVNLKDLVSARIEYNKALKTAPENIRVLNSMAILEIQENNFAKSKAYLDKSLLLEPENTATLRLLGDFHMRQKQIKQAIVAYKQSYQLDPFDPLTKRSLVTACLQIQDIDSARELLDQILQQTPGDPTGLLLKAWILAKDHKVEQAANELESLSVRLAGLKGEILEERPILLYVSALSAFALQNYHQAVSFFAQYLALVPDNIEAIALLAQTHLKLNEPKRALEAVQRHEREMMNSMANAILVAELYLANDKAFKSVEIGRELQQRYPNDPNVELLEIKTLLFRGKREEALSKLNGSKNSDSNVQFIIAKAQILIELGKFNEASENADKLLQLAPNNIDFLNLKAVIYMRQENISEAQTIIDKALAINPDNFAARFNKATVLSGQGEHQKAIEIAEQLNNIQSDTINVLTLLAGSHFNAGNFDVAIEQLQKILRKDFNNLFAVEKMAMIYARQGEPEKAIRQLNGAIKSDPNNPRYQLFRVELYMLLNQTDRVTRELAKINRLVQNDPSGLANLSKVQLKANDIEAATISINSAVEMAPEQLSLAIVYVETHLVAGDLENARKMLTKWLALKPNNQQLLLLSGDVYVANNEPDAAAKAFLKVLDIAGNYRLALVKSYQLASNGTAEDAFDAKVVELLNDQPDDHFMRKLLADFYMNRGNLDKALIQYETLIQIEHLSNRALILNNMANIYLKSNLNKARQLIEQALQEESELAGLYDTHGWILSLLGHHENGLTVLRKASAMDSSDPATLYHLAYTLHKLDRSSQAKRALERALSSHREFSERAEAEALLLQL